MRIWARVIKKDKIVQQIMFQKEGDFQENYFYEDLMELCQKLKIDTPILLNIHKKNFQEFNSIKFFQEDFLDTISFDYLILENTKE